MPTTPISTIDCERYLVCHPREIEHILRGILESKTPISLYDTQGKDFIPTSIVDLDIKAGYIYVEQGSSQIFNQRLIVSDQVTCVTHHDRVHIQFTVGKILPDRRNNEPVFRLPLPKEIVRLQRREYYRLATSVMDPVKCLINTAGGFMEATVVDISIGGMGVLAYEGAGPLHPGESFPGCRIALPGTGEFAVSLTVRTVFDLTLKNGLVTHRAGCQFIDLPPSVETEIQRYIIRVERERRARYT